MANEDVSRTSGRLAIASTLASLLAITVSASTSVYATQRIETQSALSGATLTVQNPLGVSYTLGGFAVGGSSLGPRGEKFSLTGSGNITGTTSGAALNAGGGLTVIGRNVTTKDLSGATLHVSIANAGKSTGILGNPLCIKLDGSLGYQVRTATGFIYGTCN